MFNIQVTVYHLYLISVNQKVSPTDFSQTFLSLSRERSAAAGNAAAGPHREAWSNKGSSYADLYTQNVVISMEEQEEQLKQANEGKAPKERPVWLTQSTVQGAYNEPDMLKNRKWGFLSQHPVVKLLCVDLMCNVCIKSCLWKSKQSCFGEHIVRVWRIV